MATGGGPSESELPSMLADADAAAALSLAEAARARLAALRLLEERIGERGLDGAVRNLLAENPWIAAPELEYCRRDARASRIAEEAARSAGLDGDEYRGRAGLVLSGGGSLAVLEFVRPGLALDRDHLDRFAMCIDRTGPRECALAGLRIRKAESLIVADRLLSGGDLLRAAARRLERDGVRIAGWKGLLEGAAARCRERLEALGERDPGGRRLRGVSTVGQEQGAAALELSQL